MLVHGTAGWNCKALWSNLLEHLLTILSFPVPELRSILVKRIPFSERYLAFTTLTEFLKVTFRESLYYHKKTGFITNVLWLHLACSEWELSFALLMLLCCSLPCPLHSPQCLSTLPCCPNSLALTPPLTFSNSRSQTLRCKNSWN